MTMHTISRLILRVKTVTKRKSMVRIIIGIIIGAALGFAYYRFVGCATGACPITSNPYVSTLYGAIIGGLVSAT